MRAEGCARQGGEADAMGESLNQRDGEAPSRPVSGDTALQDEVLEELTVANNYRRWLTGLASPWLGDTPIEIGSGRGDHAAEWRSLGHRVTASEADPGRLEALRQRFAADPGVRVRALQAPINEDGDHSAAVALNVLEHVPDDVAALRSFARLVRPGGHVVVLVPAFPLLMSRFDRLIGHHRRYRRAGLRTATLAAGLRPVHLCYVNLPGFFGWLLLVRLLRGAPSDTLVLRLFDRVVPFLARFEARWPPPLGQSLLCVARVPEEPTPRR
jgi:SAM-dependent methyltransferase